MPIFTGTGTIERRGDADWFAVQLTGGQAYTVASNADFVSLAFRGPFGDSLASPFATATGFNFVAPYSGRFFIEARSVASCTTGRPATSSTIATAAAAWRRC